MQKVRGARCAVRGMRSAECGVQGFFISVKEEQKTVNTNTYRSPAFAGMTILELLLYKASLILQYRAQQAASLHSAHLYTVIFVSLCIKPIGIYLLLLFMDYLLY